MDGWETCQRILQMVDLPVVILSSNGAEQDKIRALQLGADDCLGKSSTLPELLLARIGATLRRAGAANREAGALFYSDGVVTIDQRLWEIYVRGQPIHTSNLEFKLLTLLVEHPNQVLTYDQMLDRVWGPNYDATSSVKQYIGRLRKKIEEDPKKPTLILTVRGVGYRYCRPKDARSTAQLPLDFARYSAPLAANM
jgi:DNA-binding response OmpR family regulator